MKTPNFKPYYPRCRSIKLTWEECAEKYCCDMGEECWYMSEDYQKNCGNDKK
ncbi:MAG: hypothetical protein WC998_08240 [Candidatus Paceibacterota bacterium]|jgi:hypothetical protein